MLTKKQNALLNADGIIKNLGQDPEFWIQAEVFCAKEVAKFGLQGIEIVHSTREPRGKLAHYEPWTSRMVIYYTTSRPAKFIFNSVMHELAHHIHHGLIREARQSKNWEESARLQKGGRVHGLGFKEVMTTLEHENAPEVPHSPWGNAGCRGSSRLSKKDWAQRYSVKVCEKMAKATSKKNTAKTSTPKTVAKAEQPTFKVTIHIEAAMSSSIKGVVYPAQEITIFSTAKDEVSAKLKAVRSFGIGRRTDVKYTVKATPSKAPKVAAYNPSK